MDAQALVAAVAQLCRAATADFAVEEMLRALCTAAAGALPVDGAGVMIQEEGRNRFVHASTAELEPVERLQELLQAGPCADSLLQRQPVAVPDLGQARQWPQYLALTAELQLGAVLAVPLLSRGQGWGVLDLYRRRAGRWTEPELTAAQVLADLAVSYLVMAHDRDDARTAHRALAHRALHDDLTGLPNRALLFDRLEHGLAVSARRRTDLAVVFLDLDLFKSINDTYGHAAGDAVLIEVAARLSATLRAGDTLARFSGDEFVLICEGLPHETPDGLVQRVTALTDRLRRALHRPIRLGPADVVITASMGVAVASGPSSAEDLLADADTAMYAAKQTGRGRTQVRTHTATSTLSSARQLERDLALALDRDELRVHYQPILTAATGRLAAVEALLRWDRPGSTLLPAAAFIEVAVRTGSINTIGHWVIDQICAQMERWQSDLDERAPATAYVNLSSRELTDGTLPDTIAAALTASHLRPAQLGLEIVEDDLADPDIAERLEQFHRRGHPLSVDDFGTGYSSLSRLLDLPVDLAKIDKSFVGGVPGDARRTRLIDGVLLIAGTLQIQVIAEGVETAEQARHLTAAGCHLLQGYHLARPQSAAQLTAAWTR